MGSEAGDLRAHLRVPSRSLGVLALPSAQWTRCEIRDISLGGCYLMRSTEFGPPAVLRPPQAEERYLLGPARKGAGGPAPTVSLWLFHPGRADGFFVDCEVVREETGGRSGVALRFVVGAEIAPQIVDHVGRDADAHSVPRAALGVPILRAPDRPFDSALRVLRAVAKAAGLGLLLGTVYVIWSILKDG